jgi:hypothetical protein
MRIAYYVFLSLLVFSVGCEKKKNYEPNNCFSPDEQKQILNIMMHYASRLAPQATHETKFEKQFDWYYDRAEAEARIVYCSFNEQDSVYNLFVGRKARSITPMEEGIAVRLKLNADKSFKEYEEVFRMWKMPVDSMNKKGKFLFQTMLDGGDLTLYYSKFRKDEFIEFPDDRFKFDKESRRWNDVVMDTVQFQ